MKDIKDTLPLTPIAHIRTDFPEKFGIPRQSGLVHSLEARIVFTKEYRNPDFVRGIEDFSHLWLLWGFSENKPSKNSTVRPPRLGGNKRVGVFATRSPFRPNPIGLSCVRLVRCAPPTEEGCVLHVSGADLMDKTPIYDIKPYLPFADSHPEASGSFSTKALSHRLLVHCEEEVLHPVPKEKRQPLLDCLCLDPRPSYQNDPVRIYGMSFMDFEVHFRVEGGNLYVLSITPSRETPKAY